MPKKQRHARREARRMESELIAMRENLNTALARCGALARQVEAANRSNARLSQTEMRSRINRDGQVYQVQISVSDAMVDEFRFEPDYIAGMLGHRIASEIKAMSYRRASVFPWQDELT